MPVINSWMVWLFGQFSGVFTGHKRSLFGFWLIAILFSPLSFAQGLPADLQKAWQNTKLPLEALSLDIRDASTGQIISQINANTPRNPASVMKTVTTWAALSELGPQYAWYTGFYSNPDAVIDQQGTLSGPLYIKASGDPWFTAEDLWKSLRELRVRGIKNLSEVIVDRSLFGSVAIEPDAFDDSGDRPYNASPDAMMVNFGAIRILFTPDKQNKQWIPIVDAPTKNIKIDGAIQWQNGSCKWSPPVSVNVSHAGSNAVIKLDGKAIGACGEFSIYRLVDTQQGNFDSLFKLLWKELGGTLGYGIKSGDIPPKAKLIFSHASPSLADIIRQINKFSNNVMARMTMLTLGARKNGKGATTQSSADAVYRVLQEQGIDTNGWVLDNGSGLSRTGRLTASGLAQMLQYAWNSALMPEYVSSLAIAGVDGTMYKRLRKDPARGQAHMKTGTLRNARAIAGYVRGASGQQYILVSMVNSDNAAAVRSFDDAVIKWLAKQ